MPRHEKTPAEELRSQITGFVLAALGFVAGLAWNEAIKALIESIVPIGSGGIVAKFSYAIVMTLILAVASWMMLRKKR